MKRRQNKWIAFGLSLVLLLTQTTAWAADSTQAELVSEQSTEQTIESEDLEEESLLLEEPGPTGSEQIEENSAPATDPELLEEKLAEREDETDEILPSIAPSTLAELDPVSTGSGSDENDLTATTILFHEGGFTGEQIDREHATEEELEFEAYICEQLEKGGTEIDVSQFGLSGEMQNGQSELSRLYFKVINSNPAYYFVAGEVSWECEGKLAVSLTPSYRYSPRQMEGMVEDYKSALNEFYDYVRYEFEDSSDESVIYDGTDLEKLLELHEVLLLLTRQAGETKPSLGKMEMGKNSAIGALEYGYATGNGYALAMYDLIRTFVDLPVYCVGSETTGRLWNVVELGGQWYHLDAGADDEGAVLPGVSDFDLCGYVGHDHFLLSDEAMEALGYRNWNATAPECADTTYDDFYWRDVTSGIYPFSAYHIFESCDVRWTYLKDGKVVCSWADGTEERVLIDQEFDYMSLGYETIYYGDEGTLWRADLEELDRAIVVVKPGVGGELLGARFNENGGVSYVRHKGGKYSLLIGGSGWELPEADSFRLIQYTIRDGWVCPQMEFSNNEYIPSTIKLNGDSAILLTDEEPSAELASRVHISDVHFLDDVWCEYDEELDQVVIRILSTEYNQCGYFTVSVEGKNNEEGWTYYTGTGYTSTAAVGSTLHARNTNNELVLPISGAERRFCFTGDIEYWVNYYGDYLDWEDVDPQSIQCAVTGAEADAISILGWELSKTVFRNAIIQVDLSAKRPIQREAWFHISFDVGADHFEFKFPCRTSESGILLCEYDDNEGAGIEETDISHSSISRTAEFPTEMLIEDSKLVVAAVDGEPLWKSDLSNVRISDVTDGFEVKTITYNPEGDDDIPEEAFALKVQSTLARKDGQFTLWVGDQSQTFYITTAQNPRLYADEECTVELERVTFAAGKFDSTVVYLKGGNLGAELLDGREIDWDGFNSERKFMSNGKHIMDLHLEYLAEKQMVKVEMTYHSSYIEEDRFDVRWYNLPDVPDPSLEKYINGRYPRFEWRIPYQAEADLYIWNCEENGDAEISDSTCLDVIERQTMYFAFSEDKETLCGFKIISTKGDAFKARKVILNEKQLLQIYTIDSRNSGGDQSVTIRLDSGDVHELEISITDARLLIFADQELTQELDELTFLEGQIKTVYLTYSNSNEAPMGPLRIGIEVDQPDNVPITCLKYEAFEHTREDGKDKPGYLKVELKPREGTMTGKAWLTIRGKRINDYRQKIPYRVLPDTQELVSSCYQVDCFRNRLTGLEEKTAVTELLGRVASRYGVSVTDTDGNEIQNRQVVGTGCQIVLQDEQGEMKKTIRTLLYGDCTGDGEISVSDLLGIKRHILGIGSLHDVYEEAADLVEDENPDADRVNVFDLLSLKNHILGISSIQQDR